MLDPLLFRAQCAITQASPPQQLLLNKLGELQNRLSAGLLRVAVLGQFKRGKSTLLNALLGTAVLPTGITPVTAVPIFIREGSETSASITFNDAKQPLSIAAEQVPEILLLYTSESNNPRNKFAVASVSLQTPSAFLHRGMILVDTPGVGSIFRHNSRAAEQILTECDAALFVISADPPLTEIEVEYLRKVQKLIQKVVFVLNKVDLLDGTELLVAKDFLEKSLAGESITACGTIVAVSAKQALHAKQQGDRNALAGSGILELERILFEDLASSKSAILFRAELRRAIALVGELIFQSELELKAAMLPGEDLKQKAQMFEASARLFETDRNSIIDVLGIDRKHILTELEGETESLWKKALEDANKLLIEVDRWHVDLSETRRRIAAMLSNYFEQAFLDAIELFRTKMQKRLLAHEARAGALIDSVRLAAADLLSIPVPPPHSEATFEVRREPYWVAPEPTDSLLSISGSLLTRFVPISLRRKRERSQLLEDTKKAILRNLANLDWAVRQNVTEAFRRFEVSMDTQLSVALDATRSALSVALERQTARAHEVSDYVQLSRHSIASLSEVLDELRRLELSLPAQG